jgi:hypothetical protein
VILRVPVTASSSPEWVRRAAEAINRVIEAVAGVTARVDTLEMTDAGTEAALIALDGRVFALEGFADTPFTVASITLTPATLPGSPVEGMTVYDSADKKVKTWDGALWQAHY